MFYPGFDIHYDYKNMTFIYGDGTFGPEPEKRLLAAIRMSLADPDCQGPEIVYGIAMDVGRNEDLSDLKSRNLLYGAVIYSAGTLGSEPVRSQGHVHAISKSCGMSTPEIYEIWSGKGIVYMQEQALDNPGRCFAVEGDPGDVIIVPPGWAHATISADSRQPLVFGAWCVRDYGFDYADVRAHKGLAFFPILTSSGKIEWKPNPAYEESQLILKKPSDYSALNIQKGIPIYKQYIENRERFNYVSQPDQASMVWDGFIP